MLYLINFNTLHKFLAPLLHVEVAIYSHQYHTMRSIAKMERMNDEQERALLLSQSHIWNQACNLVNSMSLKCAVQLGIPDIIKKHGRPMALSDLVSALPVNPSKASGVYRLMRLLVHSGFFTNQKVSENCEEEGFKEKLLIFRPRKFNNCFFCLSMYKSFFRYYNFILICLMHALHVTL